MTRITRIWGAAGRRWQVFFDFEFVFHFTLYGRTKRVHACTNRVHGSEFLAGCEGRVWCLTIDWCFVAPKMALGAARRGSIAAELCDRGATKPKAIFGATLRAAVLFVSRVAARSLQTHGGYARRSRLAGDENSSRRNASQLRDTTLGRVQTAAAHACLLAVRWFVSVPLAGSRSACRYACKSNVVIDKGK
jgi:hypothetical protein